MISVEKLRAKYRDAGSARYACGPSLAPYCVGGALCAELGEEIVRFPNAVMLAWMLSKVNPALAAVEAKERAREIIAANDEGNIGHAWDLMARAFAAGRQREAGEVES